MENLFKLVFDFMVLGGVEFLVFFLEELDEKLFKLEPNELVVLVLDNFVDFLGSLIGII